MKKPPTQIPNKQSSSELAAQTPATKQRAQVFISHDSRDADLAEAFSNLLTDASGGMLKSFRSSDTKGTSGIEFGEQWFPAIMARLDGATDVVALLTEFSIDKPWILYETGVARGKLNTPVIGLALGIEFSRALTGPFAQFQNSADDEDSLTKLVMQLIRRNPDATPREEAVKRQVAAFRQNIGSLLVGRTSTPGSNQTDTPESNVAKMFEEVKLMFSGITDKIEETVRESVGPRRDPKRMFHPMMIEEIMFTPEYRDIPGGRATGWLMAMSALRNDLPWLYEVGMEVYRAMCSENVDLIESARRKFEAVVDLSLHSNAMRHAFRGDDEIYMFSRHLPDLLRKYLHRYAQINLSRKSKIAPDKSDNSAGTSS